MSCAPALQARRERAGGRRKSASGLRRRAGANRVSRDLYGRANHAGRGRERAIDAGAHGLVCVASGTDLHRSGNIARRHGASAVCQREHTLAVARDQTFVNVRPFLLR